MERIGIFGGTFAPPHEGHMVAALAFAKELQLDKVLLMPTFISPHKQSGKSADPGVRMQLLQLAVDAHAPSPLEVSDFEIAKGDTSYTYQTLTAFAAPNRELFFLCGTDMFLTLPIWKEAKTIFQTATIVCMRRESDAVLGALLAKAKADYEKSFGARVCFLTAPHIEISSSQIRTWLANGNPAAKEVLSPAVYAYITAHGLYQNADPLTAYVNGKLDGYRLKHTYSVAEECKILAYIYELPFADSRRLQTAALLHDITKHYTTEEHVDLLARYGETPTADELASPKTLHARTAALLAADECSALTDSKICRAIAVHTVGDTTMSLFDWLLYLADYIEPLRTFPDCVKLREFFYHGIMAGADKYQHLYQTVLLSFEMTLAGLRESGAPIHQTTLAVYKNLRANSEDFLCALTQDC